MRNLTNYSFQRIVFFQLVIQLSLIFFVYFTLPESGMFVDYAKVTVKAGDGGRGCVAFRREKHVPRGGPSGGDGGEGGDIIILGDAQLYSLHDVKYHKSYKAGDGGAGEGSQKKGADAEPVIIRVPLGTVISDAENGQVTSDIIEDGRQIIIARGGQGGRGNAAFKTATNRAPRRAEPGTKGEYRKLIFELKVISDVGLVGLPNAGKSTLISKLTAARPKIAEYPFTTLVPNLGIVKYDIYRSFVMADVPGLIEGAHKGKGLGHRFLRHLERTRLLVFLIEITDPDPEKTYYLLNAELCQHLQSFKRLPRIIALSKADLDTQKPPETIANRPAIPISAVTGAGLETFVREIVKQLSYHE